MSNIEELKTKGNKALQIGENEQAIGFYTEAIVLDSKNHILFSNRSAAYLSHGNYEKSLEDAEEVIKINQDWSKGYLRKASALKYLKKYDEASIAVNKGLELEPGSALLIKLMGEIEKDIKDNENVFGSGGMGNIFSDPNIMDKIKASPKLSKFLYQQDYVEKIQEIRKNPGSIGAHFQDKRILETFAVLCGIDIQMPSKDQEMPNKDQEMKEKEEVQEMDIKEETPVSTDLKDSLKEKDLGNDFYKKKDFENALLHYDNAIQLNPKNPLFLLNKSAVYMETKEFEKCVEQCNLALELAKQERTGFEFAAKCLLRIGNAYSKQEKYQEAIHFFKESLIEHRTADALNKLNDLELMLKKKQEEEYLSDEKSTEEKTKGNDLFKSREYIKAIDHYNEALKRNPKDHSILANKASCYIKMAEFGMASRELQKCLEMDPKYIKAYDRLGQCYYHMKEFHKSVDIYTKGLMLDPTNKALLDGLQLVESTIVNQTGQHDEERIKRAQNDPEIRNILSDPIMQRVLQELQQDPSALQKHMSNPTIKQNIEKLFQSGILSTGKKPKE